MKSFMKVIICAVVAGLLLASCMQGNSTTSEQMLTQVAQTVGVMKTQVAQLPTVTETVEPTTTVFSIPTFTPVATLLPTTTPIPPTPTAIASLAVGSVTDVTIPAGTTLQGGQTFVKTWKLSNSGSDAWEKDFMIVFTSGDQMGVSSITLGKVVYPGQSIQISATFTAPVTAGAHTANFLMSTSKGFTFGTGSNFDRPWSIKINVKDLFSVTAASVSASPSSYSGPCPATIKLIPSITANGTGTVTYYLRISGGHSDTFTMNFSAAATQTGSKVSWPIDASMTSLQVNVYVDNPNHQDFGILTIPIQCTTAP